MAEIAVQLLLERLTSLIVDEGKLLGGVRSDVDEIKDDLETMRSFLQDADSKGETDQGIKTWVKQVREAAYDIEDVLDEFLLRLVRPRKHGIFDSLANMLHDVKQLNTRHRLATEIQNIKARLKAISERRKVFSLTDIGEGPIRANTTPNAWYDPRIAALNIDEAEVVGIEVPKNILIGWLTRGESNLTIISVVGMGGLGKTTLVKKVYDSQMVNKHFDYRVWITVSKSPVVKELLRMTIQKVLQETKQQPPKEMDTMDVQDLIRELKNQLSVKRYVIIFDDIWEINVWETMRFAFPNHECGSRIIFTTRIDKVAAYSNYHVHRLEPLSEQEAWRLFCTKAFEANHETSTCPEELKELSLNILKKCSGLPLAIVLIGGLLRTKPKTVWEWKNVYDSVGAEMRNNYNLDSLSKILLLSYNNLPCYLKPCFMYLSMFPEDYFIKRMTMIRLWIAEGFVEEKQGVTLEVVAGDYVNELISRSMIQVAELNDSDEAKSYRIHDLMRETIKSKSKEECFSTRINTNTGSQGKGVELHEKARRISIYHNNSGDEKYSYSYPIPMGSRCSNIRSLLIFQLDESPSKLFGDKFLGAFRLLRVLDLQGSDIVVFPPGLVELIHLRYLSLRRTKITVVPNSIGKLKNLETLDLKETCVSELPAQILKLQRLRHLLVYHQVGMDRTGVRVPSGIGNLTCLQKLSYLDVQHQTHGGVILKELGKLTQLRRLGIQNLRSKDGRDLCLSLQKMEHLHSLEIVKSSTTTTSIDVYNEEEEFLELESLKSPPQLLRHLYLCGSLIRLPLWIASLRNLTVLCLRYSRLSCEEEEENDPLKAFQHMPNLELLELAQAYKGDEVCCTEVGGYKNLKKLGLWKMEGLKRVRFVEGSMPMLMLLYIWDCPSLEMVPHGIEHLSGLQQLILFEVNPGLVERIRRKRKISPSPPQDEGGEAQAQAEGEDCWRVQHIPAIRHVLHNTKGTLVQESLQST